MDFPTIEGLEIQTFLGKGSSGEVFRARDTDTGLPVAVKVSHPFPPDSPEHSAFHREYELHSRLRHPNIVFAQRFGELDDRRHFYVMRYLDAVPLRRIYEQGGIEPLADVALGVLGALAYTHAQNILHGDLKPSNILATRAGRRRVDRVALADFGHAQRPGRPDSRRVEGTLAYSAPEQMSGGLLDGRADLYALGISLYEAIVGRPPFSGTTEAELHDALAEGRISIGEVALDLPAGWVTFIDAMISPDRSARPDSANAAAAQIRSLLGRTTDPGRDVASPGLTLWPTLRYIGSDEPERSVLALLREPGTIRTVLVTGEEGIGKTRFVDEVVLKAEHIGVRVTRADARDPHAGSFGVFRGVLTPDGIRDVAEAHGPRAGPSGVIPPRHVSDAGRQLILDALLPKEGDPAQPRLYVFDSLECADLDSLETLNAARARLDPGVVLCLVARSGPEAEFLDAFRGPDVLEIALRPFEPSEIEELVAAHLGYTHVGTAPRPSLDDQETRTLVDWLRSETGGNPRRVEVALASLARRGSIVRAEGGWRLDATRLVSDDSAHTARGRAVLALRRLPRRLRAPMRAACVIGRDLDATLLSIVAPGDDGAADFLTESVRAGVCVYARGPSLCLRFRDPEVAREIAASLPADARRKIHLDVAEALTRLDPDGSRAGDVAEHLQKAGEDGRACEQYVRAARAQAAAGAFLEASRSFRSAWALHGDQERRSLPSFAAKWMGTLFINGHFDEALHVADDLLRGVQGADATGEGAISVLILKGMCVVSAGRREEGKLVLSGLLACQAIASYPELQARALAEVGLCEIRDSHRDAARSALSSAREVALENALPHVAGRAELYLGILEWRSGDGEAALAWHARAQEHAREADAQDLVPAVWGNQAICHWFLLDAGRALRLHRRAAERYVEQGRRAEAARSYQNLAHIFTEIGRWDEADHAIATAERLNRSTRAPRQGSYFAYDLARLALYRGRLQEATEYVEQAIRAAEAVGDHFVTVGHKCLRGLIELDAALAEAAARTGEECLRTAKEIDYPWGIAKSYYLIGCAERLAGRTKHALACLEEAAKIATQAHEPVILFRVQLARAEILAERGDSTKPYELLAECQALAHRVDSRLWHAWASLSEGKIATRLGQAERASRALGAAYETFAALGAERRTAETLAAQSEALAALGNFHAARAAAQQARVLHERLGLTVPPGLAADAAEPESGAVSSRLFAAATEVCHAISSPRRLDDVLERILDVVNMYLLTERGVIALADPRTGRLRVRCARNIDRESIGDAVEISWNAIRRVGEDGEIFFSEDALLDARLSMHESVRRLRIRAMAALPIRRDEELLGALYVDHRMLPNLFGREARDFLRFIASVAADSIHNARGHELKDRAIQSMRAELSDEEFAFTYTIVGKSERMKEIYRRGVRAAKDGRVILLQGPTGAGKDHLANVLHEASGRRGDFVTSSPPPNDTLYGGDLFGVAPGAATDVHARAGHIESAQGGTLFLNEIADLPLTLQLQLLPFLDTRKYRRVGGVEQRTFDGLIIIATNADLARRVVAGTFREDLLHRLSGCVLELPPLRERKEDIPDLAAFFLDEFAQASGRRRCVLQELALQRLIDCRWDGNIRELKTCLQDAVDKSKTGIIYPHDLMSRSLPPLTAQRVVSKAQTLEDELWALEELRLIEALAQTGGNVSQAAKLVGKSDKGMRDAIKRHHLELYTRAGRRKATGHNSSVRQPNGSDSSKGSDQ